MGDSVSTRIVVVGASAAGLRAAARARRLMGDAEITVFDRDTAISVGACGLPYFLSGDIDSGRALRETTYGELRDADFFRDTKGVVVRTGTVVERIDREAKTVHVRDVDGGPEESVPYDKLVLATGASPKPLPGLDVTSDRITTFRSLKDATELRQQLETGQLSRVALIGAGLIGCELAEAFSAMWGAEVEMVEAMGHVLPQVLDAEMALVVETHLRSHDVTVHTGSRVEAIREEGEGLVVETPKGALEVDHVVVGIGVTANARLATEAGLDVGPHGGIVVDELMRTADPDVYAAGDCVEAPHCVTGQSLLLPLGSLANRQGRAIGTNLAGGHDRCGPVAGSVAVKVFEMNVAATGLTEAAARKAGLDVACVWGTFPAIAHYYPESKQIQLKLVYESDTGRLLGLQAVGLGEVVKRVDVFGNLLLRGGTVADLLELEFAYAPPYAGPLDPLHVMGAMAIDGRDEGIVGTPPDVDLTGQVLLDVRLAEERAAKPFDAPEVVHIPLGELRGRIGEVPVDKAVVVLCERGPRAAEAARIIVQAGGERVAYLGGGRQLREADA